MTGSGVEGQGGERGGRAVVHVLVTREGAGVGVLPNRVEAPAGGQRARAAREAGQPQRILRAEATVVAGARGPPVGGAVDHGPAAGLGVVLVDERPYSRTHARLAEAVARGTV